MLGLASVGVDDSFVELGGDSISSIRLAAGARETGLVITPQEILRHRTVEALARIARSPDAEDPGPGEGALPVIDQDEFDEIVRGIEGGMRA
ncbi:phosphopantetheine-binding protein [Streptomyces stramineus]